MNKKGQTIDDKILVEVKFIDSTISNALFKIVGNIEQSEGLEEKNEKIATNESNSSKSTEKDGGTGGGGQSKDESEDSVEEEISSMSMKYKEMNEEPDEIWDTIKKSTENLCMSWSIIESDIGSKGNVNKEHLEAISIVIDKLIKDSTNEDTKMYLKDSADLYDKMKVILKSINADQDAINIFDIKNNLYAAYAYVMDDDWSNVSTCVNNANSQINKISDVKDKTKIVFKNLLVGIDQQSKEIFYIRCSDALNDIEYIDIGK